MGASGLGALLVKEGFLTEQDRVTITKTCGQGSWAFAKCILSTGLLDEDELSAFFAERTRFVVAPKNLLDRLDPGIVEQVDRRMVSRLEVLPLEVDHHRITVAVADPLDKSTLKQLEFFTGLEVVPVIAPLSQIHEGLSRLNPEFKPRPTALSNFLRNHAGAAWIKQKIVEEGDVEIPDDRQSARGGALDHYDEDQVEDVSLDEEIDAMEDSSDNLSGIDASGLDDAVGNSDFDDIDLEDSESDLELAPGEDPDHDLDAAPIDDAGLDVDDPFDSFEDAPKKGKAPAASSTDDLEGLEAAGDIGDDLWPDADDAPAKPAAPAKAKTKAKNPLDDDDFNLGGDLPDDFGLDDEPAKPAQKAAAVSDDLWPDADEEAGAAPEATDESSVDFGLDEGEEPENSAGDMDDDLLGETPDLSFDAEETPQKAEADDDGLDDLTLGDDVAGLDDDLASEAKTEAPESDDDLVLGTADQAQDDDLNFGSDELSDGIDDLLDEPAPQSKAKAPSPPAKMPMESTRMAYKPALLPTQDEDPEDLVGIEFADDEETSASLRKAVHEEGSEPEFRDPNFDDEPEETRIDLHAAIDEDTEFGADSAEDTDIRLHPAAKKPQAKKEPILDEADPLEDLAMGFGDDESIDEPSELGASDEPGIDDLALDAELADIPIEAPVAPSRAGGRSAPATENGSIASLTATAKANEALLRMSLCFDRDTALEIAREYLPQISGTGCLVNIGKTTEALATWRSGAQSAVQGKAAVYQRLAKAAKPNAWSEIPVSAQDDFGSVKAISVYKIQKDDGRVLLLAGDYPKDDDSLRDALTSLAEQLGAK
jgi:hypothetical protein